MSRECKEHKGCALRCDSDSECSVRKGRQCRVTDAVPVLRSWCILRRGQTQAPGAMRPSGRISDVMCF